MIASDLYYPELFFCNCKNQFSDMIVAKPSTRLSKQTSSVERW